MKSHTVPHFLLDKFAYDDPVTRSRRLWQYSRDDVARYEWGSYVTHSRPYLLILLRQGATSLAHPTGDPRKLSEKKSMIFARFGFHRHGRRQRQEQ